MPMLITRFASNPRPNTIASSPSRKGYRLSIDPGITGTGLAFWREGEWSLRLPPCAISIITPPATMRSWEEKEEYVASKVAQVLLKNYVTHVYCELPEYFADAHGVMVAKEGNLAKLILVVGMFWEAARHRDIPFHPIPVAQWKGQLPKFVVEERIRRIIPTVVALQPQSHAWDAIGIGLYAKGFLNVSQSSTSSKARANVKASPRKAGSTGRSKTHTTRANRR